MKIKYIPKVAVWLVGLGVIPFADAPADQWQLSQFSTLDPVLTFESGHVPTQGIQFSGGTLGAITFPFVTFPTDPYGRDGFCNEANVNFPNFRSYLDITFDEPKRAIGANVMNARYGFGDIGGATMIAYDQSSNVVGTVSAFFSPYDQPPFLGIGGATTNIYRVEWRYLNPGWLCVDNVIYEPGPAIALTNTLSTSEGMTFSFQTLAGHTNVVEMQTNSVVGEWTSVTNYLGDGTVVQVALPITNSSVGMVRVKAQ